MGTAPPVSTASQPPQANRAVSAGKAQPDPAPALVPVPAPHHQGGREREEQEQFSAPLRRLPVELDVVIPVEEFRVRDLLTIEPGNVVPSRWSYGDDVPLSAGDVQLAWSEFEVIDTHLAVRITRLP